MIKYNLKCNNHHEFESWFADSKEFEKLKKRNLLECIYCNSRVIKKSIMSFLKKFIIDRLIIGIFSKTNDKTQTCTLLDNSVRNI